MRPIPKDIPTTGIEPGRTLAAGTILVNLMTHLAERYDEQYDILPSIDVSLPEQDFTCDLGIFPPRLIDWQNDLIRVEPPITAFEIVMPTETIESLTESIRQHYFANGVQSAFVVDPVSRTLVLLLPNSPAKLFSEGLLHDPASKLEINVAEIFS